MFSDTNTTNTVNKQHWWGGVAEWSAFWAAKLNSWRFDPTLWQG